MVRLSLIPPPQQHASTAVEGFAAVAGDIADIKHDMATKEQIVALHTQVNSIETQLRGMKHTKLQARVTDLEEEVFGKTHAYHPPHPVATQMTVAPSAYAN